MAGETEPNQYNQGYEGSQPMVYHIRIKGHLSQEWTDWFDGLTITQEDDGITLLKGSGIDQAALHGILKKVRDLGVPLLSVNSMEQEPQGGQEATNE